MWKESYRIGVDVIDRQHKALFQMVDELLTDIENGAERERFQDSVKFLKNYVIEHFHDEEAYQESIHYSGLNEHRLLHLEFAEAVRNYEEKLMIYNYAVPVLKDLAGMLTAWLIYHVADADQKIVSAEMKQAKEELRSYAKSFTLSIAEVLSKMVGIDRGQMHGDNVPEIGCEDSVYVEIGLTGDRKGTAVFGFSKELAFNLVKTMTFREVEEVDELVCSALAEVSNISSGNAATYITKCGFFCDIKTPVVHTAETDAYRSLGGIRIDSGIGPLDVAVRMED